MDKSLEAFWRSNQPNQPDIEVVLSEEACSSDFYIVISSSQMEIPPTWASRCTVVLFSPLFGEGSRFD